MAATTEDNFKFGLDIHFAQRLAGNVTKIRERTVKKLKRWIAARSLKLGDVGMEPELMRLWKGLFYCMWMCDKPVIQEEMADKIADLVHSFTTPQGWNNNWEESLVDQFLAVLCKTPLSPDPEASPDGLRYHFIDIYRAELARCGGDELTPNDQVMKLIDPFCVLMTTTHNKTLLKVILRGFFQEIVDESDVGFPVESEDEGIDSGGEEKGDGDKRKKESEEDLEKDEEEGPKEINQKKQFVRKPRPKLKYDYGAIADRLFTLASQQSTPGLARKKVYAIVKKFRDLTEGVFPDYNVGSLLDYQDDDDETERIFGERLPPDKKKKPTRRGGKQVRERRLAKVKLQAARDAAGTGKRFADVSDEDDWTDEDEEDQKRKKRRKRKKKKAKKVEGETMEVTPADAEQQKEMSSELEDAKKGLDEEGAPSEQATVAVKESVVSASIALRENDVLEAMPSPGSDEADGGSVEKMRGEKRKSGGSEEEVPGPSPSDDGAQETETTAEEDPKMGVKVTDEVVVVDVASSNPVSHKKGAKKLKGRQVRQKQSVDESEREGSSDFSAQNGTNKEETSTSQEEIQLNVSEVSEPSPSTESSKIDKASAATSSTSPKLNAGSQKTVSEGGKRKVEQPFAAFQAVSTPPALVRRKTVRKGSEPKTEPPRKTKSRLCDDSDSDQPTPRKRVKIALGLNKAHASQDYKKQLESSPGIPFDGSKKPTQSVLKTPSPQPHPPGKKKTATPTSKTPRRGSKSSPPVGQKASTPILKTAALVLKTPSPKVIKEVDLTTSSRKRRSPKTAPILRRSSRIKKLIQI
ncbi:ribosomal RNA processing protein 1 homolog B-like [Acanthaster planci]|uniref:Ribosomal RNA processing protein 1 homolog B-like n=1 Tax=Acanthaster planci TaxID=133434 RepID=A0A8B7ZGW5_ACAPL|nr:ribosomal RNA processing protein 1 homolog B-like [Acanthaster planci]